MIRAGVGHSLSISASEAIEQATTTAMGRAQFAKADLTFVFATYRLSRRVRATL